MASLLHLRPKECRLPDIGVLPDGRPQLTRWFEVANRLQIPPELDLSYGALDDFPQADLAAGWQNLRLMTKRMVDDVPRPGSDSRPFVVLTYEQMPATAEQLVGQPVKIKLEDGRDAWEYTYQQFTAGAYTAGTVGTSTAPGDATLYLKDVRAEDNGAVRRIVRTYVKAGTIAQDDQELNNGKLLKRTITSVKTVPATPSGYVLVGTPVQNPNGLPIYTYTFYKGDGEISRKTAYGQSDDEGATGSTTITIQHLTAPSVSSQPTSSPGAGYALVLFDKNEQSGHRLWTAYWAKGTGLVVDSVQTRSMGGLKVYTRVALGAGPSAPSATIGGTVTLFDTSTRKADGYNIYEYRWSETAGSSPNNRAGIKVSARTDGSLVYTVSEYGAASATPAYPGTGTGYQVDQDNNPADGYWLNVAVWIKPPPTVTLKQEATFFMPGEAEFETGSGLHNLLLKSSKQQTLLADHEISYATTQDDTAHYSLLYGTTFTLSYIRAGQTTPEFKQQVLRGYVASADSVSGTAGDLFNGMACESYSASLTASSPTALPTGTVLIAPPRNELYLTAIDGTKVYRITKISYEFS